MITREDVLGWLQEVRHPGKQDRDIVELGMVGDVEVSEAKVSVLLSFPARRDPLSEYLIGSTRAALVRHLPTGVEGEVKTEVREAAAPKKTNELSLDQLKGVRHIIGVASGKGGVGKSTVAVGLALGLAKLGCKVGLADADVYGPSVPTMTGTEDTAPGVVQEDGMDLFVPLEKYGVKWMSVGYFASRGQALIWRGPMACSALKQMILQVKWGELDYLIIDMPPGTGDIHISLVQEIPMEGAIIVTTPQNVALADVEKGVNMFRNDNIKRRIFGIVENMAWFTPAEHPDEKYFIFGQGGGERMAREFGLELLAQIPLVQSIREGGDSGDPTALTELAEKLITLTN